MQQGNGQVTIALLAGGGCKAAAENLPAIGADFGLYLDVQMELGDGFSPDPKLKLVSLAEGESVGSLIGQFMQDERFAPACQLLRSRPGDLTQGLAQTPVLGAMAFEALECFDSVVQQLLVEVRALCNGAPERIRILTLGSNSGGTGRGVLLKATRALAEVFNTSTDAVVSIQQIRIGAQTFNGLGRHIRDNNAIGVEADLGYTLSPYHGTREVRSLFGLELPMVGPDKASRDRYVRYLMQALLAEETQEYLGRQDVNEAVTSQFGRVNTAHAGIWQIPELSLEAAAAAVLLPQVNSLLEEPDSQVELAVEVAVTVETTVANEHDELVRRASLKADRPGNWREMIKSKFDAETLVFVHLDEGRVPVDNVGNTELPKSLQAYREERDLILSVLAQLETELAKTHKEIARLKARLQHVEETLEESIVVLFPSNWIEKGKAMMANRAKDLMAFKSRLKAHQKLQKQLEEANAMAEVLYHSLESMNRKRADWVGRIELLKNWLMTSAETSQSLVGLVKVSELDQVFADLVKARVTNRRSRFTNVLTTAVVEVTRKGLTKILGLEVDAGDLAMVEAMSEPQVVTPPWGGRRRKHGRLLLVLPQVDEQLFRDLQQAAEDLDADFSIVKMDTVNMSVVLFEVFFVTEQGDYLTTQYKADLAQVDEIMGTLSTVPLKEEKDE